MAIISDVELYKRVVAYLRDGQGLSVVRFGDGEYRVASGDGADLSFRKHLGEVPDVSTSRRISRWVRFAWEKADIRGISDNEGNQWEVTRQYFLGLGSGKECRADFHTVFMQAGYFKEMLRYANGLIMITGHDPVMLEAGVREWGFTGDVRFIRVPLQVRYFGKQQDRHFPDIFDGILKYVDKLGDLRGWLCWGGAGFVGKPYPVWLADRGCVALDIGSVFDRFAGRITRGELKGTESDEYRIGE